MNWLARQAMPANSKFILRSHRNSLSTSKFRAFGVVCCVYVHVYSYSKIGQTIRYLVYLYSEVEVELPVRQCRVDRDRCHIAFQTSASVLIGSLTAAMDLPRGGVGEQRVLPSHYNGYDECCISMPSLALGPSNHRRQKLSPFTFFIVWNSHLL